MPSLYNTRRRRPGASGACRGVFATGSLLVALLTVAACSGPVAVRPNVLLVIVSGLRADHVSAYGYRRVTTPTIDSLASSGTLYEEAIAAASSGLASQASILTGLYPSEHAVGLDHQSLDGALQTLAEKLKETGYATFAVTTDPLAGQSTGFFQGVDQAIEVRPEQDTSPDDGAASAETALVSWLAGRKGAGVSGPFFAYVVLTNPHLPFNPPGEYRQKFLEKPIPLPRLEQLSQYWLPFARQFALGLQTLAADEQAALVALYDGEIAYADYRVGRLVDSLRAAGTLDDTLVIVTSDVGEALCDHGLLSESSRPYDSIVKVPLVMRLPGGVSGGRRVRDQVQTIDISSAVLELTAPGAPRQAAQSANATAPMPSRPVAFCESRPDTAAVAYMRSIMPGGDLSLFESDMLAARTREYKYIVTSRQRAALFDLAKDPGEQKTILNEQAETARKLSDQIQIWQGSLKPPPGSPASPRTAGPAQAAPPPAAPTGPTR